MMIIFRPQRSTLEESMAEAKEFESIEEMKKYIVEQSNNSFSIQDIVISTIEINDTRTGWEDSKFVSVKLSGKQDPTKDFMAPQAIGICATRYRKLENSERKDKFGYRVEKTAEELLIDATLTEERSTIPEQTNEQQR